jgi:hypothetical protein
MQKTTLKDILLAAAFGGIGGAILALIYVFRTEGF